MLTPLSLIDFCTIYDGESAGESMARSVRLAQAAERLGYLRIWYAEHHNMRHITSSAPAVLISHIGAHTSTIRLGAGGVMLPNHSPYVIAEQFGMLAELYPGRIDLGLGRAPGTDFNTLGRALRRPPQAAAHFPEDIAELAGFFSDHSPIPGVVAVPGTGTQVPMFILGSSMFGAQLAAERGLPYAFASHFAPAELQRATRYYREHYQPSTTHPQPYLIAAVNVTIDDTSQAAHRAAEQVRRARVRHRVGAHISETQLDTLVASPQGQQIIGMLHYHAIGTAEQVVDYLTAFQTKCGANELMISLQGPSAEHAANSMHLLATAWGLSR